LKYKLTIIIPTLNSEKFLKESLFHLKKQTFKNFIIYVADGGSKDRTLKIFEKSKLNYKIISKKDTSTEDGINKCLKKINTKFFCILGSDDFFDKNNYLENILKKFEKKNFDIIFPDYAEIYSNKKVYKPQGDDFKVINFQPIIPGFGWVAKKDISQFLFNTKYKMATDYEYLLRIYKKKYKFYRERGAVYCFRLGAKTYINYAKALEEFKEISLNFNGSKLLILYFYYKSKFKFMIKRLLRK
jgi:glycosyltransferase involved in cell wall biosynthesis